MQGYNRIDLTCIASAFANMVKGRVFVVLVVLLAVLACAVEARHRRRLRSHSNRRGDFDFFFLVR